MIETASWQELFKIYYMSLEMQHRPHSSAVYNHCWQDAPHFQTTAKYVHLINSTYFPVYVHIYMWSHMYTHANGCQRWSCVLCPLCPKLILRYFSVNPGLTDWRDLLSSELKKSAHLHAQCVRIGDMSWWPCSLFYIDTRCSNSGDCVADTLLSPKYWKMLS